MSRAHRHGRRDTIDALRGSVTAALTDPAPDTPRTLVLTAGPGAGKSHTLEGLRSELSVSSRSACADDMSWRQPFAVAAALIGTRLPETIADGYEDDLYGMIDTLCAAGPLALFVDDAHHADAATLNLLSRLSAASRDLPLVLVIGRRPLPERDLLTRLLARPTVREWFLPPMTRAEVGALCGQVLGAEPDRPLADALASAGGNPMHAISLLRALDQSGGLTITNGHARLAGDAAAEPSAGNRDAVAEHLALLDPRSREFIQKLAVWGGPATLTDLAAIDAVTTASLVGAAQSAADAGIVIVGDDGTVAFTHDLYAEVTYDRLAPAFRAVLHDAIAALPQTRRSRQAEAHHRMAAGTDPVAIIDAVRRAESELANTPAVAVDLLDTLSKYSAVSLTPTPGVHISLATALARTGQLARASAVASEGLAQSTDIDEIAALHQILLFALLAKGDSGAARDLIEHTLALPVDGEVTVALTELRDYVDLLQGRTPVPAHPYFDVSDTSAAHSVSGLIGESLRLFLRGHLDAALTLSLQASDHQGAQPGPRTSATTSADIWPPLIELYAHGPAAADELLAGMARRRSSRGTDWMTAYHEFTRGGVELSFGHLDDAAAIWDAGLELAASADMGWTSIAEGSRAILDVLRGDLAAVSTRLEAWEATGDVDQFGLPVPARARALLSEARRRLRPAAAEATTCWDRAVALQLQVWLPMVAVDCARIGTRAHDMALLESVVDGLDALDFAPLPFARAMITLARTRALASLGHVDLSDVVAAGQGAAAVFHDAADQLAEAGAWEESACAAAALGDRETAREFARNALLITQSAGAVTVSTRIASRLRPAGVRVDPRTVRDRPKSGWASLTPTEVTVAELVASGLSGAEIADRLFISARTVQTHVSHALGKLGLRTRVELAAYVATRSAS